MLFDYLAFIDKLRKHDEPEKRKIIEKWEKFSNVKCISDEPYYEYLDKFKFIPYKVPNESINDFDWKLLLKLVAGSFSSDYSFVFPEFDDTADITNEMLIPELSITVNNNGEQKVTKFVSELWPFQILRLFEIYCEEEINFQNLKFEDEIEDCAIKVERKIRINKFEALIKEAQNIIKRNSCFI